VRRFSFAPEHEMSIEQQEEKWKRIEDAPHWVREAASLLATVPGASIDYVAYYLGHTAKTLKTAVEQRVVQEHIKSLQFQVLKKRDEHVKGVTEDLTSIIEGSVKRLKECLPEATPKEAIAMARFACEVHPEHTFTKLERSEHKHEHQHHVSGAQINMLKERHLTAKQPVVIDVTPEDYDKPEHDDEYVPELVEA
jgi:hypothetical protein